MTEPGKPVTRIKSAYMHQYDAQKERARRRKKQLFQRLIIIGAAFAVIFAVMITYHFKQRMQLADMQEEYAELMDTSDSLEKQENVLLEEIGLLNDDEYILDIARTNYFLSKKGELIFQVEEQEERAY